MLKNEISTSKAEKFEQKKIVNDLFVFVEILDYIEKNNVKRLNELVNVVCTRKNSWFGFIYEYPDIFVDYFEKI